MQRPHSGKTLSSQHRTFYDEHQLTISLIALSPTPAAVAERQSEADQQDAVNEQ
jgi:hypothetical protein